MTLPGLSLQGFSGGGNEISLSVSIASQQDEMIYFLVNKIAVNSPGARTATVYELSGALPGVIDRRDNSVQIDLGRLSSYMQNPAQVSVNELYRVMRADVKVLMIRVISDTVSVQDGRAAFNVARVDVITPDGAQRSYDMSQPTQAVFDGSSKRFFMVGFGELYQVIGTFVANVQNNYYTSVKYNVFIAETVTITPVVVRPVLTPIVFPSPFPVFYPVPFPVPFPTSKPGPTASPTAAPTVTPTISPTATPTATPTVTPTVTPTAAPTVTPTVTPEPTITAIPSPTITKKPTPTATAPGMPTFGPSPIATKKPTLMPITTGRPTLAPTGMPIEKPTVKPTPGARPTEGALPTKLPVTTARPPIGPIRGPDVKPPGHGSPIVTALPPIATAVPPEGPVAGPGMTA